MIPFIDLEGGFLTTEELLFLAGASGGGGVEHTIINNPATFTTDMAKPLRGLLIPFMPKQSGSGDPSPDNIRPITGWTGLNIYRSGEDTSDPLTIPVSWQTEAGEVYCGTLDALTGVMTVTHKMQTITGNEGFVFNVYKASVYVDAHIFSDSVPGATLAGYCSMVKTGENGAIANALYKAYNNRGLQFANCDTYWGLAEVSSNAMNAQLREWYEAGTPLQVVYELATPQTVQLDPVTLSTLIGENVLWTDTNGDNTIVYLKKT